MNKKMIFSLSFLLIFSASAQEKKKDKDYEVQTYLRDIDYRDKEPSTWSLGLGYQNLSTKIEHGEKSDSSEFFPLGYETDMSIHVLSAQLTKEVLSGSLISFTAMARYGIIRGADNDVLNEENLQFEDNASGNVYGGGLTMNLNMKAWGLKVQPFVGTQYIIHDFDYELNYSSIDNGSQQIDLTYFNKRTSLQHSVGMRFIDESKSLMSYLSVDFIQNQNDELSVFATQGDQELNITEAGLLDQRDLVFGLGFGVMF